MKALILEKENQQIMRKERNTLEGGMTCKPPLANQFNGQDAVASSSAASYSSPAASTSTHSLNMGDVEQTEALGTCMI